jgi:ketosteroid isomerase-like protein
MKKIIYLFAGIYFLASCNNNEKTAENSATAATESAAPASNTDKAKPVYSYPVKYTEWEIGNSENIKTVLDFYTAWDHKDITKVAGLFADTVRLRIPTERNEILVANNVINEKLIANRGMYDSTSNNILSAVSLHDRESNEDWVMITTYNKWVEKDGKRDSVLYHDDWRLKNGKIDFLMSFYKLPTKTFLKKNDPK